MPTLIVSAVELDQALMEIRGDAYRHLFRARRLSQGDRLRLADGQGQARWAVITEVGRDAATVAIGETAPTGEPERVAELYVATIRSERANWLVQKATEVGVSKIVWFNSRRAPRSYGEKTLERQRRIACAAAEQSERAVIPAIEGPVSWPELEKRTAVGSVVFFDTCRQAGGKNWPNPETKSRVMKLLVGPEGGWDASERALLLSRRCEAAWLGERVLRVETAAVLAAALWIVRPTVSSYLR